MTDQSKDQEPCNMDHLAMTLAEKVRPIQERAEQMGFALMARMTRHSWTTHGAKTAKIRSSGILKFCGLCRAG